MADLETFTRVGERTSLLDVGVPLSVSNVFEHYKEELKARTIYFDEAELTTFLLDRSVEIKDLDIPISTFVSGLNDLLRETIAYQNEVMTSIVQNFDAYEEKLPGCFISRNQGDEEDQRLTGLTLSSPENWAPYFQTSSSINLSSLPPPGFTFGEAILSLTDLTKLSLISCGLMIIPDQITRLDMLEKLNLHDNHIPLIPDALAEMGKLRKITLTQNPLVLCSEKVIKSGKKVVLSPEKRELLEPSSSGCSLYSKVIIGFYSVILALLLWAIIGHCTSEKDCT